jgi:hypothetical protein
VTIELTATDLRTQALVFVGLKMRVDRDMLIEHLGGGEADAAISECLTSGLLREVAGGRLMLADDGKQERAAYYEAAQTAPWGPALRAQYDRFLPINARFLAWMNRWQVRDGVPNDHDDADYDGGLLEELATLHSEVDPIFADSVADLPRLSCFRGTLAHAHEQIRNGDSHYVGNPRILSYHQTWFELHQDLMDSLGIARSE